MKAHIRYIVRTKVVSVDSNKEFKVNKVNKVFDHKDPIYARDQAINYCQSYVEVLLQSVDKEWISDSQARIDLNEFISPASESTSINLSEWDDFKNGIGVFVSIVGAINSEQGSISPEEYCIYGFGNIDWVVEDLDDLMTNLWSEYDLYQRFGFVTNDLEENVRYCYIEDFDTPDGIHDVANYTILPTPFDWSGREEPYWWIQSLEELDELELKEAESLIGISHPFTRSITDIIQEGEGNQIEFKPALIYNYKTKAGSIGVKQIIAKAIAAFLNSNGGVLLIGVNDRGLVQGLDEDFSLNNGTHKDEDFFKNEFDDMLSQFLGMSVKNNVIGKFYEENSKKIFAVQIEPSRRPVFLINKDKNKLFFIRGEASTREIKDIEELINYCIDRFE